MGAAVLGTPDDVQLGAFCVTEPDAGSDVSSLRTRAVYDEATDEWVLERHRRRSSPTAASPTCTSSSRPSTRRWARGSGQRSSCRPARRVCRQGKKDQKLGIRASHTAEVVLDDVRVPGRLPARRQGAARRASWPGPREAGHVGPKQPAMSTFEATRPVVGAQAVGIARAAFEFALDYAKERIAFGKPIIINQGIAFKLADMAHRDRRRPAARVARRVDGPQRRAVHRRPRARCRSSRPARSR